MWLEGPLQSWGVNSKYGRRDTLQFPTKSGVLGIILCAMGKGGEQKELLSSLSCTDLQVDCFTSESHKLSMTLEDFHMVGANFDESDPWETLFVPKKSDGNPSSIGGKKLTYRYYIQNMAFAVYLEVQDVLVNDVCESLKNPVWPIFLGRKSCVPSELIFQGKFSSKDECIRTANNIAYGKERIKSFSVLQEDDSTKGDVLSLSDVPVQFGEHKKYKERYVTIVKAEENAGNIS